MKSLQLAINYGMSVKSLAKGLNAHALVASAIIQRHQQVYSRYWEWREEEVERAMQERRIESVFGWPLHLSHSPNKRTLYNFPMQSGGAEMLRLAAVRSCEAGLIPCMLVHDAVLFELDTAEQVEHAKEIMRQAGRDVCDGFEIGVDVDQKIVGGGHYADKRDTAKDMWKTIMEVLDEHWRSPEEGRTVTDSRFKSARKGSSQRDVYLPLQVDYRRWTPVFRSKKRRPHLKAHWAKLPKYWVEALRQVQSAKYV